MTYVTYILMVVTLAGIVGAQILLRKGILLVGAIPHHLSEVIPFFLKVFSNPWVLGAILSMGIAGLAWIATLSKIEELSRFYPLLALSYVLVVLFSAVVFKENVTYIRWIGVVLIAVGVVMVTRT